MKTILLPVDFSEASRNAVKYALRLYREKNRYVLLHSYDPPSSTGMLISIDDIVKRDAEEAMKEELKWIDESGFDISKIMTEIRKGELFTIVNNVAKKQGAGIIILGTTGASGFEEFIGSNASNIIQKANIPVMAVPFDAVIEPPKLILFPIDLSEEIKTDDLNTLIEIASTYHVAIDLLYVSETGTDNQANIINRKKEIDTKLDKIDHQYIIEKGSDPVIAISEQLQKRNYSLLVLMPKKYSFLEKLFKRSVTSTLAMKTHIPLLALKNSHAKVG